MPNDYVDEVIEELVSGNNDVDDDYIGELVDVGAIDEVGANAVLEAPKSRRGRMLRRMMVKNLKNKRTAGHGLPSPPFGRSSRDTERRAPLGFIEDVSGANFFTLAAGPGTTTTMRAKVSREAHADRLLIVPSAPGVVFQSIKVGDEEQLLAAGAPVELYSTAALTDAVPDNFSPLGPALDFIVTLFNTTAIVITGTIGIKASCKR